MSRKTAEVKGTSILLVYAQAVMKNPDPGVARRVRAFADALAGSAYRVSAEPVVDLRSLETAFLRHRPDIVFSTVDHLPCREPGRYAGTAPDTLSTPLVNVHGWLERRGIPYAGSPPDVIDAVLSKSTLKREWSLHGIATPAFIQVDAGRTIESVAPEDIPPFPCIVKPDAGGNSRGISRASVVGNLRELRSAVRNLETSWTSILVEHYLGLFPDFREFTCALVGNGGTRRYMTAELVFTDGLAPHPITTADKETGKVVANKVADPAMARMAECFAAAAFSATGVTDYSRLDFVHAQGGFHAIEVNGQPMVPEPWFDACARHAGLSVGGYLREILDAASARREGSER